MPDLSSRAGEPAYEAIADILRTRAGLVFPGTRRASVESEVRRAMERVGVHDPGDFAALLTEEGAVFDDLVASVTIGETYFFRERDQFEMIRAEILPLLRRAGDQNRPVRAWSAACATGEEAHSLAITLADAGVPALVLGTDVSRPRLAAARRGQYRRWSLRGMTPHEISRLFREEGEAFVLSPAVRRTVEFRYLNLVEDTYPAISTGVWGMDIIMCRNVLIYFDQATIAAVARALLDTLSDDGWLLLGASDPSIAEMVPCEAVQTGYGVAYHRAGHRRPSAPVIPVPVNPPLLALDSLAHVAAPEHVAAPPPVPAAPPFPRPAVRADSETAVQETLADAYARRAYEDVVRFGMPFAHRGASAPSLILLIRALANLGRLGEAERVCMSALDRYADAPELHYLHAILLGQAGLHAESAAAAKRALYLNRALVVAHLALGTAAGRTGDTAGARRAFAAAEKLLATRPAGEVVPASDGEPAGRLLEMTRVQQRLLGNRSFG